MASFKLIEEIVNLSEADEWKEAQKEWIPNGREEVGSGEEFGTCLCSHYPLKELCHIKNKLNGNEAIVGNCCIQKFFLKDVSKAMNALSKGKLNEELILASHKRGTINGWERDFLLDVWRKRKFSPKQLRKLESLKRKIFDAFLKSE